MQLRALVICVAGALACEPLQPIIVAQSPPLEAVAYYRCTNADPVADKRRACDDVVRACAAGGYYSGGMDVGLGVIVDCLDPLRKGKAVARVAVDTVTLHACFGARLDDVEGYDMASNRGSELAPPPFRDPK